MIGIPRSLSDLIAQADQLAGVLEDEPGTPPSPLAAVELAAYRRAQAEKGLAEAVRAARAAQLSWRELGQALGTTGEAARQRYADS